MIQPFPSFIERVPSKAIFLDKDGTLIPDIPYNVNPGLITLSEGVVEGLRLLQASGYLLVIISNQSGIAHGYFAEDALTGVQQAIDDLCARAGIYMSGFYYCPHHPNGMVNNYTMDCTCRKPKPGLILKAGEELYIDLAASWMIGDILHDVEAGKRAGCRTVLINNGNETEWVLNNYRSPDYTARTMADAARYIVSAVNSIEHDNQLAGQAQHPVYPAG